MKTFIGSVALIVLILALLGVWYYKENSSLYEYSVIKNMIMPMKTIPTFTLTSPAFAEGGVLNEQNTCDGAGSTPALTIAGAPTGTQSLTLIMDDPDVPRQIKKSGRYLHWVVFNIPPDFEKIGEGEQVGIYGANETGKPVYTPPCPPPGYQPTTHRYRFELFALDTVLDLKEGASEGDVRRAMDDHVIAHAMLTGIYSRL